MKPIEFDGMRFGKAELTQNREDLIQLRDEALKQGVFAWAVSLSHTIAIMAAVIQEVEE